jgi:hypothetical protein
MTGNNFSTEARKQGFGIAELKRHLKRNSLERPPAESSFVGRLKHLQT